MPRGKGYGARKTRKKKRGIMSHGAVVDKLIKSGTKPSGLREDICSICDCRYYCVKKGDKETWYRKDCVCENPCGDNELMGNPFIGG
jgi:hypothetical protein